MDSHVKEYFVPFSKETPAGCFHKVISLLDSPEMAWQEVSRLVPALPKGWCELIDLSSRDRIDFLRDYWLSTLPFCPHIIERLDPFFEKLDDVGVYLYQRRIDQPWKAEIVYSIKNNGGFFRGGPPAKEDQLYYLQKLFPETILPEDYTAFLRIHNGFSKASDTGITPTDEMEGRYREFQLSFEAGEEAIITTTKGMPVNPKSLIPFYESFGMPFYQCFWSDWYPENEMGNVYYSGISCQISSVEGGDPADQMAFKTFADWLFFYLETVS